MAQASYASSSMTISAGDKDMSSLTNDELRTIQQYAKIVQFRDSVLSGSHPRIKVPSQSSAGRNQAGLTTNASHGHEPSGAQPRASNSANSSVVRQSPGTSLERAFTGVSVLAGLPVGLEQANALTKPEELARAELQMQRQRIEKALKDQVERHRIADKAAAAQASAFDLTDILAKALTLVQATAPPQTVDANVAANALHESDSFDDDTFYSSQHDTPEPHISPPAQSTPANIHHLGESVASLPQQTTGPGLNQQPQQSSQATHRASHAVSDVTGRESAIPGVPFVQTTVSSQRPFQIGGLLPGLHLGKGEGESQATRSDGSVPASRANGGDATQHLSAQGSYAQSIPSAIFAPGHHAQLRGPLIRAHDLSPFAPQPAHVSPLATARQPPVADAELSILHGAPAPVAALRQEPGNATSSESSPQGGKQNKHKNKKRIKNNNKRKAHREGIVANRPQSPEIKAEPQSPSSPMDAPNFVRPPKRQRQMHRRDHEPEQDDFHRSQPPQVLRHEEYDPRAVPLDRLVPTHDRVPDPYAHHAPLSVTPRVYRVEQSGYEVRRLDDQVRYVGRGQIENEYVPRVALGDTRLPMRAPTYSVADPSRGSDHADFPEDGLSSHPFTNMARSRSPIFAERQPVLAGRAQPHVPITVRDEHGREYHEPPPPAPIARHSMAPPGRASDYEVIYERAPIRAASRVPGPEYLEQDGVVYRRASPVWGPRRVVTQPDHGAVDYRPYRPREYTVQPLGSSMAGQESLTYRGQQERRAEEAPREYLSRAASVRPTESVRYDYGRTQSVRPDLPLREYAASAVPEPRRDMAPQYLPDFGSRAPLPVSTLPHQEYGVRPAERYYERSGMQDDDVAYIERPRTGYPNVPYDNGPREMYR